MAIFRIDNNRTFSIEVTVRESEEYTQDVYVKFERHYNPEDIQGCNEVFISTKDLERLGRFFLEQAGKISTSQKDGA